MAKTSASVSGRPARQKNRATAAAARTGAGRRAAGAVGKAPAKAKAAVSRSGRKAARVGSTLHIGRKRKPTISTRVALGSLKELMAHFPTLYTIWRTPELDPAFREELMVAVATQNDAPYCNWAHRTWAETVGASSKELEKIEQLNPRGLDPRKWTAVRFVRTLVAKDFQGVPASLRREMEAHYTAREIRDIELVARVMDLINRTANTYEGMLRRLQGKPNHDTHVVDEMVFSGVFLAVAPLMVLLLSRSSGRPYVATARGLIDHVQRSYAQQARG